MQTYSQYTLNLTMNKIWNDIMEASTAGEQDTLTQTIEQVTLTQTIAYMRTLFDEFRPQTRFKMATYWFQNVSNVGSSLADDVKTVAQQIGIEIDELPPSRLSKFKVEERMEDLTDFQYMYFVTCAACQVDHDPWACLRLSMIHFDSDKRFPIEPDEQAGLWWLRRFRNKMIKKDDDEKRTLVLGLIPTEGAFFMNKVRKYGRGLRPRQ